MRRITRHITPSMVVALIALSISLGGVAYAAATIRGSDIVDGSIQSVDIANDNVTSDKLEIIPYLKLYGARGDQPCSSGEYHDLHFASQTGSWSQSYRTTTGSRTPVYRAGKYAIAANYAMRRIVMTAGITSSNGIPGSRDGSRVKPDPGLQIVAYSASGQLRVLASTSPELGTDNEPDTMNWELNASALERLAAGETIGARYKYSFRPEAGPLGTGCVFDVPEQGAPSLTIAWLGK